MNTNNSILSKKSKRISVSFTPGEYDTLHSKALSYNQSDSAYIRNCILNKWNPVITPKQYAKICNTSHLNIQISPDCATISTD